MNIKKFIFSLSLVFIFSTNQFIFCAYPTHKKDPSLSGEKVDPMVCLPKHIQIKILSNLSADELLKKAGTTSKAWNEMVYDWRVWNQKSKNITGFVANKTEKTNETAGYSISNVNEAVKILNFLQKLKLEKEQEKETIDQQLNPNMVESKTRQGQLSRNIDSIGLTIKGLMQFFNSPQLILNNLLKLEDENFINLPVDLPDGEQPAWPDSQIQINWRKEWKDLDEEWNKINEQEIISSSDLNNHLFARLLICAKAYFNKNNNLMHLDQIQGNDLFKSALKLLSSEEEKYTNIRSSLLERETINLNNKEITSEDLPFVCFFLKKLNKTTPIERLSLDNNQLTTLPEGVFNDLGKLKRLHLSNQLTTLPAGVFNGLEKLKWLYLYDNQLTTLPAGVFNGLEKLKWLYLENNQLTTLPAGVFNGLEKLKDLNLHSNQLTTLPIGVFNGLEKLETLSLDNNQLTTLPEEVFNGLEKLKWLNLEHNQLTTLPAGVFNGLEKLKWLYLKNNQLTWLPENLSVTLPEIKSIFIQNAGLNNKPINIPIKQSARESFKLKLYLYGSTIAEEGKDYNFAEPEPEAMETD